ncbi:MAG: flagellar basal body P-ring formation chaperone FlgA [Methylomonas sp.]|nr:flagellar basal body P-ring formation chaperone FlgA [Methylomonas sp.]
MKTIKLFCLLLVASRFCVASPTQSLQSMQDAALDFARSSLASDGQYQITSTPLDDRLQLPACDRNLEVFAQSGEIKPGRNTVGIRCTGTNGWTIYTGVIVKSFKEVLVLTKQLNRNDRIKAEYLTTEIRDIATLQHGYTINPEDVINKQVTRILAAGTALNSNHYAEPTLVNRGDQVSIQSGKPGLLIATKGIAMSNGIKGQKISVKNIRSQRVIQATVVTSGVVTVYF